MKTQALFSSKYKSKKLKCCLLQLWFGALRVNSENENIFSFQSCTGSLKWFKVPFQVMPVLYLLVYKIGILSLQNDPKYVN